jgi:hypothetical protein
VLGAVEDLEDPTHIGMGQGHRFSPVQRGACLPAYRTWRHITAPFDVTIFFNIPIVNNLNVEYNAFIPTRVVAGFLRKST